MAIKLIDTDALRRRGLHHEADAYDFVMEGHDHSPLPSGIKPAAAGGEHPATTAAKAAGSGRSGAAEGGREGPTQAGGPGGASGGAETAPGGGGHGSEDGHSSSGDSPGGESHGHPDAHPQHEHTAPEHILRDDPTHGIRSVRLREHIEHAGFRAASADAQDSEIARRAAEIAPGFRHLAAASLKPYDISLEARAARLAAVGNDRPPSFERESALESGRVSLREVSAPTSATADIASALASRESEPSASLESKMDSRPEAKTESVRPSRTPRNDDRER